MKKITSKLNSLRIVRGAVALASAFVLLTVPVSSIAGSFSFDGIVTNNNPADPNTADSYTEQYSVKWWDAHGATTAYPQWQGDDPGETGATVRYGKGIDIANAGTVDESTEYSWLFLEVPLLAKNMIYQATKDLFTADDIAFYGEILNFDKATGSEKVVFGDSDLGDGKDAGGGGSGLVLLDFAKSKDYDGVAGIDDNNDSWDVIDFRDSTDWLLGAGSAECGAGNDPATDCYANERTMSFEVKLAALANSNSLITAIQTNGLAFHLSPECVECDDGVSEIPVPAAFWLFGTALIGFIGYSRRTNLG
jgi:hypothetical protein